MSSRDGFAKIRDDAQLKGVLNGNIPNDVHVLCWPYNLGHKPVRDAADGVFTLMQLILPRHGSMLQCNRSAEHMETFTKYTRKGIRGQNRDNCEIMDLKTMRDKRSMSSTMRTRGLFAQ